MIYLMLAPALALLLMFMVDWHRGVLYWHNVHNWAQGLMVGACTAAFVLLQVMP